ncbi:hypothetical protein A6A08_00225 [Nocardiopsis sp. TSRI0078]|uniref:hypothetical protein n=1 Tax=unclassified Nocardiopsis TaxID=2649073 RepID=UPI00094052C8|nr:hypothetical protein [Nocardiopsis sp. TSRI0078]OKI23274.1 hypothetical protein A6A08_00225 [Nocardiopsis sp. TSRI0078]
MPPGDVPSPSRARWLLAGLVLAAFAALLALRIHHWGGLDQTALFYVGLPATIALLVVFTVRARSVVGVAMACTTVGLALSGPLLGEGLVCLVVAAPLVYGVVALVAWVATLVLGGGDRSQHALLSVPLLFVLALEGVAGISLLPRADTGEGHAVVSASAEGVAAALAAPPEYEAPEALFLRAVPFPRPVSASGGGLEVGDTRLVRFTPRSTLRFGDEPTPRHMELRIVESEIRGDGGRVVFEVVEDTAFANWMDMRRAEAVWRAEGTGTRLTWSIDYERTYEPSWYFGPVQSYATDLAAEYLAATFGAAVPGDS